MQGYSDDNYNCILSSILTGAQYFLSLINATLINILLASSWSNGL